MPRPIEGIVLTSADAEPVVGSIVLRGLGASGMYPWKRFHDGWYTTRSEMRYDWRHVGDVPVTLVFTPPINELVGNGWPA